MDFVVKIFLFAVVMGGFCCGIVWGGGLGGVGWCAFKEKVTGAFKEKVTGAFKHRVIFDFLCLRYVWYYIYKILGSPTRLSIRGGRKNQASATD